MSDEIKKELEEEIVTAEVDETPTEVDAVDTDEVPEDADPSEKTDDVVEEKEETADASEEGEVVEESEDKGEEAPTESEEAPTDTPVEGEEENKKEEEEVIDTDSLKAEIDDLKFDAEMRVAEDTFRETEHSLLMEAQQAQAMAQQALEMAAQKFDIPLDKSMAELETLDPKKAALAKELLARTQSMLQEKGVELERRREDEAAKLVFKKAERVFEKYKLNEEQAKIAAETFIDIIKATGVNDLADDLVQKVELSVAKALMKSPIVMDIHDKIEEIKTDTSDSKITSEKIETEAKEEIKEEKDVPPVEEKKDLSAYMEGAVGGKTSPQGIETVTVDNVLDKLAELPFKDRVDFLKEHMDLYNQAMSKARS